MRYDDMLATVLAQPQHDATARLRIWRQIIDLLAQGRHGADEATVSRAFAVARAIRAEVPLAVRAAAARACVASRASAALIAFLAEEVPEIAGPLLSEATLDADEWLAILPQLSSFAKGQLRAREGLPEALAYALGVALDPQESGSQISDLLSRIEAHRRRPAIAAAPAGPQPRPVVPASGLAVTIDSFRFTIGEDGMLIPRQPAPDGIGPIRISAVATGTGHGVDSHAAGAWRRRSPFSEARLSIGGDGMAAGQWRISAEPCFAAPDGRFVGYAGEARRPRVETPAPQRTPATADVPSPRAADPQRIDRLFEALRGPLDAIGLLAGGPHPPISEAPSTEPAPARAGEAGHDVSDARLDAAAVLSRLHATYQNEMASRGVTLSFRLSAGLPPIAADPDAIERMFGRLLAATLGVTRRGECVAARLALDRHDGSALALSLSRPGLLIGLDTRALLGPALDPDGDYPDAPRLAMSFAIRLVRKLAGDAGGGLAIAPDRFVLTLPLARAHTVRTAGRDVTRRDAQGRDRPHHLPAPALLR